MKHFACMIIAAVMLVLVSVAAVCAADIVNVGRTSAMDIMLDKSTVIWSDSGQIIEFTYITVPKTEKGRNQFNEFFNVKDTERAAYKIRADRKRHMFNVTQSTIFNSTGTVTHQNTTPTQDLDISQTDGIKLCYEMITNQKIGLLPSNAAAIATICYREKNYADALSFLQFAAQQGNATAMSNIGNMYVDGHGVMQDYSAAMEWYKMAVDKGKGKTKTDAMYNIGCLYKDGLGVTQNYTTAMEWYKMAADKGSADAMNNIGAMYAQGHGVARSHDAAIKWYKSVAQNDSFFWFQKIAQEGNDAAIAMEWYRKAADKGDATAMYNIGCLYRDGNGVAQSYDAAIEWYKKAAELGNKNAKEALVNLNNQTKPVQPFFER